jgi:hypothetical protein
VWYDGAGEQFFKGGWSQFVEDHDLHQGFSWPLISMLAHRSSMWESTMAPSARRSMKPKCSFTSFLLYVIQLFFLVFIVINNLIGIMCLLIDHGNKSWFRGVHINIYRVPLNRLHRRRNIGL